MEIFNTIIKIVIIGAFLVNTATATEKPFEYAVIGAGAAGLSAAYALKKLDRNFILLEKNSRSGGIAGSGTYKNFHYAKGTEYLGEAEGHLARVINELNIPMVEIPSPMDASYYQGNKYIGDKQITKLTIEQSSSKELQKFIDLLNNANHMKHKDLLSLDTINAKQWLNQNKIAPFIQHRYNIMSRGLFGANLSDISALSLIPEASFDFINVDSIADLIEPSQHSESWTTQTGIATITTSIAKNIGEHIRYHSKVEKVQKKDGHFQIDYLTAGKKKTIYAEKVIIATPAPIAANIAQEVLTTQQLNILTQIQYAQYATVALFSDTPIFNQAFDLAILDGDMITDLYDATWVERHYNQELRNKQAYIASAYIAPKGVSDRSILKKSDQDIMHLVYKELSRIVPNIKQKVTGYDITRFKYAYPVINTGYYTRLHKLKSSFNGVFLAGDYMFYPTFDAAFESGFNAVMQAEKN